MAKKDSLLTELAVSGASVGTATTCTNPLDVVKVRLQLHNTQLYGPPSGLFNTAVTIVRAEGVLALWKGLTPSLVRGLIYGGLRLGLYTPIKSAMGPAPSFGQKLLAGTLSGGFAAMLLSPTELVKTRLQAASAKKEGAVQILRQVVQTEGIIGLWRGAMPGTARASVLTAAQCASYDEVKRGVMHFTGWGDTAGTHFASSMASGLVTTTMTSPVDVIKTRMFMGGRSQGGMFRCAGQVFREDGVLGFFKGWSANYARLGPQTVIIFLVAEKLRKLTGLQGL